MRDSVVANVISCSRSVACDRNWNAVRLLLRETHFTISFQILVEPLVFITNTAHTMQSAR